jgi:hypothetical protein
MALEPVALLEGDKYIQMININRGTDILCFKAAKRHSAAQQQPGVQKIFFVRNPKFLNNNCP